MASGSSTAVSLSGLASGIDWQSIVTQLVAAERAPETALRTQQTAFNTEKSAFTSIGTQLATLNTDAKALSDPTLFNSRTAAVSGSSITGATAGAGASLGTYSFNIGHLATDAIQQGTTASGKPLSPTNDVSSLVLAKAGFGTAVTAGTFTVNGKAITIAATDTLQSVFDQIHTATGGAVTGSYNAATDEISLTGGSPIILGSATDTSNFLQAAKLYNNGTGTITSTSALGGVNLTNSLSTANLATTITDGGGGNGEFLINGVQINFNSSNDNVNDVLTRINNSAAGVTATYDSVNNRFELTNKSTGDVGISLQDVTGNFLAATGLSGGTLQRGNNLQYTINGGGTLTSQSNIIDSTSSGLTGLSVTASGTGLATVTVTSDTPTISSAITKFVTDYNSVQNYINSQIATTTDSSGNRVPGTLTGNSDAEDLETSLRQLMDAAPGVAGVVQSLNDLGIVSNGNDNTLAVSDTTTLNSELTNNLGAVQNLFTNATNGLAITMGTYLTNLTSSTGLLATTEGDLTKQSTDIDTTIAAMEVKISDDQQNYTNEFVAMETAENSINQQKQFLTDMFSSTSQSASGATVNSPSISSPSPSSSGG
jgi:flagellar hook-associated protein 2